MPISSILRGWITVCATAMAMAAVGAGCQAKNAPAIDTSIPQDLKLTIVERPLAPGSSAAPAKTPKPRVVDLTKAKR